MFLVTKLSCCSSIAIFPTAKADKDKKSKKKCLFYKMKSYVCKAIVHLKTSKQNLLYNYQCIDCNSITEKWDIFLLRGVIQIIIVKNCLLRAGHFFENFYFQF